MQYIARQKGETRSHLYDDSQGYPIRVCNWEMSHRDFIEIGDAPYCKNCHLYQEGKRISTFAPIPQTSFAERR
ncbi:hypothetical protein LCGC14_0674760 [marine sediment metagenome]|uniref:Uncharacterized protein n=1 Tax=marine sediment metagenome TaxID=412755 RepID=A0A0F9QV34_9ZZZZ